MAHQDAVAAAAAGDHHEMRSEAEELLQAHLQLRTHALAYLKCMALKCAMDLRIPDTIHRRGGDATVDDLLAAADLPPSSLPYLRRLMRALTALRFFTTLRHAEIADPTAAAAASPSYQLTATSRLLLTGEDASQLSLFPSIYSHCTHGLAPAMRTMRDWMARHDAPATSPLEMALGKDVWESMRASAADRAGFYDAMDADCRVVTPALLRHSPAVFRGLTSLVDVGGGRGTAAAAVARAFPHVKCTVMDLPHVVADAPAGTGLCFVAGDMFDHIPAADALLLKRVLHDWDDARCIKILQRCKEAISRNDQGRGKVVIIDNVFGYNCPNDDDTICMEAHALCDLGIMFASNGAEREEQEWRRIFLEAGFCDYKITHIRGALPSIIEVYPGPVES